MMFINYCIIVLQFGEESMHLMCLNSFIVECHEKFKTFFRKCCQLEDLDKHFNIHQYTEATLIQRPEIYISLQVNYIFFFMN